MAVIWAQSWDALATADLDELTENFAGGSIGSGTGRNGTNCFACSNNGSGFDKYGFANQSVMGAAFGWEITGTPSSDSNVFCILDGTTVQMTLCVRASGIFTIFRGNDSGTLLATSAANSYFLNTKHHIQFMCTINNTTGTYELRVDGATILSGTAQNTRASANNQGNGFRISNRSSINTYPARYDDLVVWNNAAGNVTTFPGDCRVFSCLPSGAGNSSQMTPSAGSNYQCVDDATPNGSDYVSESTLNEKDTYAFADIVGTGTVLAAQLNVYAQKNGAGGTRGIKGICRSVATETLGTEKIVGTSFRFWNQDVFELDPNTGAQWASVAALNAAEFGVKLTT